MAGEGFFGGLGDFLGGLGSTIGGWLGGGGGAGELASQAVSAPSMIPTPDVGTGFSGVQADVPYGAAMGGGGLPSAAPAGGGPGGGSFWDTLKGYGSDVGSLAKSALPFASLATTGMGVASGIAGMEQASQQNAILKKEQQRQQQLAAPAAAAGASLTSAGQAAMLGGALPAQLESQVQELGDRLRAQYRQYLASIGQSDSTAAIQEDEWVNQQQNALREQLAQQLLSSGYQGIGTAMGPSSSVSGTAANLSQGGAAGVGGANAALSKLLASQG